MFFVEKKIHKAEINFLFKIIVRFFKEKKLLPEKKNLVDFYSI